MAGRWDHVSGFSRAALPGGGSRAGLGGALCHHPTAATASPPSRPSHPAGHLISTVLGKVPSLLAAWEDLSSETSPRPSTSFCLTVWSRVVREYCHTECLSPRSAKLILCLPFSLKRGLQLLGTFLLISHVI